MPKEKSSVIIRLRTYVSEFGNIFTTDNKNLFCTVCNIEIASDKRFTVTQHMATEKHLRGVNRTENKKKLSNLFHKDLHQNLHSIMIYVKPCLVLTSHLIN